MSRRVNRHTITTGAAMAAFGLAIASGCARSPVWVPSREVRASVRPEIVAEWSKHRRILQRILDGHPYSVREYETAVVFFEGLTSIEAGGLASFVGRVPPGALRQATARWDEWFKRHAAELTWDPVQRGIRYGDRLRGV
ncbi:MAG: hypothetical protein LAO51_20140 [Acidobacteriia bacterium]|nr:hypothetical protein [Terriglobia bacterium]